MNINRLILVGCLLSGFAAPGVTAQSTSPKASGQDATTRRESKRLRKAFGLALPDSANSISVLKTPKTKATYL